MRRRDSPISQKQKRPQSLPTSRNWRLIPPFLPPCSGGRLSRRGLTWSTAPNVPFATTVGGRAAPPRPPESEVGEIGGSRKLQEALLNNGTALAQEAIRVVGLVGLVQKVAEGQGEGGFAQLLTGWKTDLEALKTKLTTVDGLTGLKDRLTAGWLGIPKTFPKSLKALPRR